MKKLLSFMLVLAMVLSSVAPAAATVADDSVANLNEMGIVQGYADGTFGLENNITRAEFAAIVVRMLGLEDLAKNSVYTSQFPDVSDNWYVGYVNVAAGKGIIKGNEDGTFAPQANVTYAQAATMIVRYLEEDVTGTVWPANYLAKATELGVLENSPAAGDVMAATTRGTVFTMANNALKTGEANKPVVSKVKALVVENSRVESLSSDEIVVRVMDDYTRADMANGDNNDDANFNGLKAGAEFSYTVKKNEDVEYLLGKVVNLGFTGSKVTSVEVSDEYDYLSGIIEDVDKDSLEVDGDKYTVTKEDKFANVDADRRFYQAYINGEDKSYTSFDNKEEYDFARVTVKNGKVLFIDAYDFIEIAPISEMKNDDMSVYEDDRKARIKKYDVAEDYDAEDLIEVVVKDGKTDLYRLAMEDIDTDQVAHFTDNDQILVRTDAKFEGEYTKVRTKKVDGDDETVIHYGSNKNEVNFEGVEIADDVYDNRQAIFSKDGKDFETLESNNFKKDLEDFEDRDVEVLVDMFDMAQLIRSDFQDPRFFGVVDDMIADKIDIVGTDNKSNRYYIETKTDIYTFELGKDSVEDIYDPKDELEDIQEDNISKLLNENDIVYIEVKDDSVIDTMVVINIPAKEYFKTNILDKNYIKNLETKKSWEVDDNTKVYYLGDDNDIDDVQIYDTVEDFLKDYDVDDDDLKTVVTSVVIEAEDTDDLADVIVVRDATEEGDLNEDMIVKITDVDVDGDTITLVFEDADKKEYEYEIDEDSAAYYKVDRDYKELAKELNISESKAKTMLLKEDDIVEIEYLDSNKLIKYITGYITVASEDSSYTIYRVLDVKDSGAFVLGYDKDSKIFDENKNDEEDYFKELGKMDEDDFEDINGICEVRINRDADQFGDEEPDFVMVHVDSDTGRIDATVEIDEDDAADDFGAKLFAKVKVGDDVVVPNPDEDETAEVTVEIAAISTFKNITVEKATVGTKFQVVGFNSVKDFGETVTAMTSEKEVEVELLDADDKKVGSFMINVESAVEDKEVVVEEN